MNKVQKAIYVGAHEESGIWEVLNDICASLDVDRPEALSLLKNEIEFILSRDDVFLVKSKRLYESEDCLVLSAKDLSRLTLQDVEFKESGPFYYLSNVPSI